MADVLLEPAVRLAQRARGGREAGYVDPIASRRFRLFWRWKSKPVGRPALPKNIQELIRKMAAENPTWGEEHIANELKLKLGIRVSLPARCGSIGPAIEIGHVRKTCGSQGKPRRCASEGDDPT